MISSYKDKRSEAFANGEFVRSVQGFDRQCPKRPGFSRPPEAWPNWLDFRAIAWKRSKATGPVNTDSHQPSSGEFVSIGPRRWSVFGVEIVDYH